MCTDKKSNLEAQFFLAMVTAADSMRSFLHALSTIHFRTNNYNSPLLSFSAPKPFPSKAITLKSTLNPHSPSHIPSSPPSFDAYTKEFNYEEEDEIGVEKSRAVTPPPGNAGRLYVGNLPYSMTSAQLAEIFNQAGTVESVEIVCDRVTDRSRGFAFVTMASNDDASNAIRMFSGSQIGGRTVKVNFPEVPRGGEREMMGPRARARSRDYVESPYKVYAGNLGWTVTSESLKDAFFGQPGLLGAKVIYEHDSGRSRGFGFVSFVSPGDAQSAIEAMNGKEVGGRPLRLNIASEDPP